MNPVDRAIFRVLVAIPMRVHYTFPIWLRRLLNRWMKHAGDPGDR